MNDSIIISINLGDYGSTGAIMRNSLEYAHKHGNYDYLVIVPKDLNNPNTYTFGYKRNIIEKFIDYCFFFSILKPDGFKCCSYTKRIVNKIKEVKKKYKNCVVHIHNLHHCNINLKILFSALSKMDIKICYTLHDAWPLTGGCYCFNYIKCFKWTKGCAGKCPLNIGNRLFKVNKVFKLKEKYFNQIKEKTTLICVSKWLEDNVKKSFLQEFKSVRNYGECSISPLSYKDTSLIDQIGLNNKRIILTVSEYWNEWKGVGYIYKIADKLPGDYAIVVVGGKFDVNNYKNIKHVNFIENSQLNHFYSIADVYISTSQDESLGLTTCEAQICGVPVVAFGHGGVKETISEKSGYVIGESNNVDLFVEKVKYICEKHPFKKEDIIKNGQKFAKYEHAKRMLKIYNEL